MDRMLFTAMSGAKQSLDQQAVVTHNLANAVTPGFRAQLMELQAVTVDGEIHTRTRGSSQTQQRSTRKFKNAYVNDTNSTKPMMAGKSRFSMEKTA